MKRLCKHLLFAILALSLVFTSCKKLCLPFIDDSGNSTPTEPEYSTPTEFYSGICKVVALINEYHIYAYLDTLENGLPDIHGRKVALSEFGYQILYKLQNNQVESAVYDIFHFDGTTFSLISFLMKARMVGDISVQTFVLIVQYIPLPPIRVDGFNPPLVQKPQEQVPQINCCDNCKPKIKIRVTWTYKPACGNYTDTTTGYAANNTLNHMSGGKLYRFDAEVTGCACPGGVWTNNVEAPDGAAYGAGSSRGNTVSLIPISSGTYRITFTYKVCDKEVSQTFTLSVN